LSAYDPAASLLPRDRSNGTGVDVRQALLDLRTPGILGAFIDLVEAVEQVPGQGSPYLWRQRKGSFEDFFRAILHSSPEI
jgi:hypothetical protein